MAWIRILSESEVEPRSRLGRLYRACVEPETGAVDQVLAVHSLRPETLDAHLRLYASAMRPREPNGLGGRERELVALVVSASNGCEY